MAGAGSASQEVDTVVDCKPKGTDLRPLSENGSEDDGSKGDSGPRHPSCPVPRISFDFFSWAITSPFARR